MVSICYSPCDSTHHSSGQSYGVPGLWQPVCQISINRDAEIGNSHLLLRLHYAKTFGRHGCHDHPQQGHQQHQHHHGHGPVSSTSFDPRQEPDQEWERGGTPQPSAGRARARSRAQALARREGSGQGQARARRGGLGAGSAHSWESPGSSTSTSMAPASSNKTSYQVIHISQCNDTCMVSSWRIDLRDTDC